MPKLLLSKSEITTAKALERQREIDEGLKLARQVDRLREVKAEEEKSLALFRQKTVAQINDEIQVAQNQLDTIRHETKKLEKVLKKGTSEIDEQKELLKKEVIHYDGLMKLLTIDREQALQDRKEAKEELKKAKVATFRAETNEYRAYQTLVDADRKRVEAETLLKDAREIHERTIRDQDLHELAVEAWDKTVAAKNKEISIKEAALLRTERLLKEREIRLRDREATLERELKRLKK